MGNFIAKNIVWISIYYNYKKHTKMEDKIVDVIKNTLDTRIKD